MKKIFAIVFIVFISLQMNALNYKHSDSIDVLSYQIKLEISKFSTKDIAGSTTLSIVPKLNIQKFCLDLLKLQLDSVKMNGLEFTQYTYNDTLIAFLPSQVLAPSDTISLTIFYHGIPKRDPQWGGFYYTSEFAYNIGVGFFSNPHVIGRFWYPCVDDFTDRAVYDYYITTKPEHVAVCGGVLQGMQEESDGKKTWHWHLSDAIPTYLSSVAVGPFISINDVFNGQEGEIPIQLWAHPSDSSSTVQTFSKLKQVLQAFEESFGPYRWQRVGYVMVPFDGGAMEHATNIAFPESSLGGGLSTENLYAHELAHHWFGDLITCASAPDMWINEGWASFCENIFKEKIYGFESAQSHLMANHLKVLQTAHTDDDGYYAVAGVPHNITYGTTVYDKGADVVHTLRHYLGDSVFFPAVQQVLNEFAFQPISTLQLRDALSAASGVNLHPFFDAWVQEPGFYHFSVDSFQIVSNGKIFETTVNMRQKLRHAPRFALSNRVELAFISANQHIEYKTMFLEGEIGAQTFNLSFEPVSVMVDLNQKMADAITSEFKTIKTTGTHNFTQANFSAIISEIADSAFLQASFNWVTPDSFKVQVPGLSITNYAYWKIDGFIPSQTKAKGRFNYKANINGIPVVTTDSIVLLYRASAAHIWRRIPADKSGGAASGSLTSRDFLQTGEYAVGLWNFAASVNKIQTGQKMKIYPNPTLGKINVKFQNLTVNNLQISNSIGKIVFSMPLEKGVNHAEINTGSLPRGVYFIRVFNHQTQIATEKLIVP